MNEIDDETSKKYQAVFNTPIAREVMTDLLAFCGVNSPTRVPGDTNASAENEGKRLVGLHLLRMMTLDLDVQFIRDQNARYYEQQKNRPLTTRQEPSHARHSHA